MLGHLKNNLLAIDLDLRTAPENNGKLDKEQTTYDDLFDVLRLSCNLYRFT